MKLANIAFIISSVVTCLAPSISQANQYLVWDPAAQPLSSLQHKASRMAWGSNIVDRRVQIYIDISPRVQRLHVIIDGVQVPDKDGKMDWKISSGRPGYTSPIGTFSLDNRWRMAYSRKYDNSPMPFAQFVSGGKIGMHGTSAVNQLGHVASHGCIRLHTTNAERLYRLVETVLVQDCSMAGLDRASCPLTDNKFKLNPSQNVGVTLYDSRNSDTMYGMPTNLPWLASRRPAPRVVEPAAPLPSREEVERADVEDRAYEEEERRRTQELNRQYNEMYLRQQGQTQNSPSI